MAKNASASTKTIEALEKGNFIARAKCDKHLDREYRINGFIKPLII